MLSVLQSYISSMREKRTAMHNLQEISSRLLRRISIGDTGSLADILEARAAACAQLGKLLSLAPSFDLDVNGLAGANQPEIQEAVADILEGGLQLDTLRVQTLAMQSECEEALRAALAATAGRLCQVTDQRKVRSAYCKPAPGPSRFLDKKK